MSIQKRLSQVIFFSLITITCYCQKKADTAIAMHYQTKDFDVAIFPASYKMFASDEGKIQFTPSKVDIDKAEEALKTHINDLADNGRLLIPQDSIVIHSNMKNYKRQYFGYVDSKGSKILFIIGICNELVGDWYLKGIIMIHDAGSCCWHARFDLSTNKLFGLDATF